VRKLRSYDRVLPFRKTAERGVSEEKKRGRVDKDGQGDVPSVGSRGQAGQDPGDGGGILIIGKKARFTKPMKVTNSAKTCLRKEKRRRVSGQTLEEKLKRI